LRCQIIKNTSLMAFHGMRISMGYITWMKGTLLMWYLLFFCGMRISMGYSSYQSILNENSDYGFQKCHIRKRFSFWNLNSTTFSPHETWKRNSQLNIHHGAHHYSYIITFIFLYFVFVSYTINCINIHYVAKHLK